MIAVIGSFAPSSSTLAIVFHMSFFLRQFEVGFDHDAHELLELYLWPPAELPLRLGRISHQRVHFRRTQIAGINLDMFVPIQFQETERFLDKFLYRVALPIGDDKISRPRLLKHEPHRHNIFRRIAPVPPGLEVSQVEFILQSDFNPGHRACDLSAHESRSPSRALVIKMTTAKGTLTRSRRTSGCSRSGLSCSLRIRAAGIK